MYVMANNIYRNDSIKLRFTVEPVHLSVLPREGAPRLGRDSQLRVGRDTELYRILNMHYNKSNVYQVSASLCR